MLVTCLNVPHPWRVRSVHPVEFRVLVRTRLNVLHVRERCLRAT